MNPKNLAEAAEAYYTALVAKNMQSPLASVREGLAVESALEEAHKQLLNVAKMAPSDRTRTADIYDPTSGLFTPTQVPETLRLAPRERVFGDRLVISVAGLEFLQSAAGLLVRLRQQAASSEDGIVDENGCARSDLSAADALREAADFIEQLSAALVVSKDVRP